MRRTLIILGLNLALAAVVACAAEIEISSDLMQDIEDTTKDLDSNVSMKNSKAALADAESLTKLFSQVEEHFTHASDAVQGVTLSQQSKALVDEVSHKLAAGDFDAAAGSVDSLEHTCKQCHKLYKTE